MALGSVPCPACPRSAVGPCGKPATGTQRYRWEAIASQECPASIPASAPCGDAVSGCKPRPPRAARAEMLVPASEATGVADAMIQAEGVQLSV